MTGIWTVAATAFLVGIEPEAAPPPPADEVHVQTTAATAPAGGEVPVHSSSSLEVRLLIGAYLPRLNGDTALGAGAPELDLSTQLDLNTREPTLNVELTIRKKEIWDLTFGGFAFSTETSNVFSGTATWGSIVLNDGDPYQASFDMTTLSADLAVAVWRPFKEGSPRLKRDDNRIRDGRYAVDVRFSPLLAMRFVDVEQSLASGGIRETAGGEWVGVMLGLDASLEYRPDGKIPLLDTLGIQAGLAAGPALGGDGGLMWQVRAGLTIQLIEPVGVMVGYRLVEMDVENGDYKVSGGLQGLFIAASFRF
jgi:hypothetical protein